MEEKAQDLSALTVEKAPLGFILPCKIGQCVRVEESAENGDSKFKNKISLQTETASCSFDN
jgi:hypothetical protein